jgi:ABC-2 type transport system permease protein
MSKTLEIMRYEIVSALRRPSFLFFAFGVPLIAIVAFAGYSIISANRGSSGDVELSQESHELEPEGYVDLSGLIKMLPQDLPANTLVSYASETEAQEALEAGDISGYYIVLDNYIDTGEVRYIHPDVNPIAEGGQDWVIRWTLYVNMLGGDMELAANIWHVGNFNEHDLSKKHLGNAGSTEECLTPGYTCESNPLIQLLPIAIMAIIYISIVSGGSYLLRLVSSEKDSRVMELLLLSASTNQLLNGKVIGYCILGFFQVFAWFGAMLLIFKMGGASLNIPPGFELPTSLLVWGLIFFLLGYAVYASLMAGAGAITPKLSQYTSVNFIVSMPLLISYALSVMLAMKPHSPLAVVLSMFPLSAPVMMITRLTVGGVPFWQPVTAAGFTFALAVLILRAVARMFRAQALLSGQPFSISRYLKILVRSG